MEAPHREVKTTTCYMCACRCGIRVHLKDGAIRYIDGNPDHPLNKGVICAKGASGIMKQNSPARLTRPLRRKAGAARGAGDFQKAQGFMGGSFNTREFFHGRPDRVVRAVRWAFLILVFPVPAWLLACGGGSLQACVAAFAFQFAGLLAERWAFFAEARHPQNLYYQSMA